MSLRFDKADRSVYNSDSPAQRRKTLQERLEAGAEVTKLPPAHWYEQEGCIRPMKGDLEGTLPPGMTKEYLATRRAADLAWKEGRW